MKQFNYIGDDQYELYHEGLLFEFGYAIGPGKYFLVTNIKRNGFYNVQSKKPFDNKSQAIADLKKRYNIQVII